VSYFTLLSASVHATWESQYHSWWPIYLYYSTLHYIILAIAAQESSAYSVNVIPTRTELMVELR